MRTLKTTLLLLLSLLLVTSFAQDDGSFLFDSEEGKFSVEFPAEYIITSDEKEEATTFKINCLSEEQTYFAAYSLHAVEIVDHQEMADVSYESFIAAVGGKLLSRAEWQVDEYIGLMALIDMPDKEAKVEYRVLLIENTQYQLVYLAPNTDYNEDSAAAFFNSFELNH